MASLPKSDPLVSPNSLLRARNYSDEGQNLANSSARVAVIRPLFGGSRALATGGEKPAIPKNGITATKARANQSSCNTSVAIL
jgi:hypothetical protein